MSDGLKMYVWEGVLTDYSSGMAVALANSVEEAKALLRAQRDFPPYWREGDAVDELDTIEPSVVTEPAAFVVAGGA